MILITGNGINIVKQNYILRCIGNYQPYKFYIQHYGKPNSSLIISNANFTKSTRSDSLDDSLFSNNK